MAQTLMTHRTQRLNERKQRAAASQIACMHVHPPRTQRAEPPRGDRCVQLRLRTGAQ
jgi:hypothetical protein